jgi:hypothetical protein
VACCAPSDSILRPYAIKRVPGKERVSSGSGGRAPVDFAPADLAEDVGDVAARAVEVRAGRALARQEASCQKGVPHHDPADWDPPANVDPAY